MQKSEVEVGMRVTYFSRKGTSKSAKVIKLLFRKVTIEFSDGTRTNVAYSNIFKD